MDNCFSKEKTMNKTIYRIAGVIMALALILGNTIHTKAAGSEYYVSPTGSDTNPGTSSAPFKTFAKANSMLTPGSTLHIYAGVYNQQLKISKSGTSSAGITIQPLGGAVVIDMQNTTTIGLDVRGSYVTVTGLEVMNSRNRCVNIAAGNVTLNGLVVHDCTNQGIQATNSANTQILNSRVYRTVLSNAARSTSSGWGAALRIASDSALVQNNIIYNNYGEGIVLRGANITVRANTLYDNYAYNIYANNSENALIERNFVYCTTNSGYEFQGAPAAGIGMGEEYVEGWGARLKNTRVINNIVAFCKHSFRYKGANDRLSDGGLKNATIAYNTLYGSTDAVFNIAYESGQTGTIIANNIVWQAQNKFDAIRNPAGLTFQNNLWKAQPPAALQNPADKIGEPGFAGTPAFTPESYLPGSSSLAAGAAVDIGVSTDFYARQRGPGFDIGAIQFATGGAPASQATATATSPVVQPTNTLPPATSQATASPAPTSVQPTNTVTGPTATLVAPTITPTAVLPTLAPTQAPTRTPTQVPPTATAQPTISAPPSTGSGMWITSNEINALPTSGAAWDRVKNAAYGSWGAADLTNQDNKHDLSVLAGALVYARTGDSALRSKVRDGVMAAKRSLDQSGEWQTDNGVLATGRQLGAYVIAADLIDLRRYDAAADNEFRFWLSAIRTTEIGTHGRWTSLTFTCENAAANWSAFACASRIAASIYLGDTADVDRAANIMRAAFGERSAYPADAPGRDGYFGHASSYDPSWACDDANWIAINPSCVKDGINIDGALVEDASRGGGCCVLQGDGMMYSKESLQGFFFSAELLYRTGRYGNPYNWSNQALKRSLDFMQRSGWEFITFVPWLANDRYGTSYPQPERGGGRIMSWGDWLYQR
jgi:hypothetical protein